MERARALSSNYTATREAAMGARAEFPIGTHLLPYGVSHGTRIRSLL